MAMQLISGITTISVDGVVLPLDETGVKVETATITRDAVVSKGGGIFMKETPVPVKITFSVLVPSSIDPTSFNSKTNSNIVLQLAPGITFNASGFASTGTNAYDAGEGKLELEFFGGRFTVTETA
jgi:hypothetical protein